MKNNNLLLILACAFIYSCSNSDKSKQEPPSLPPVSVVESAANSLIIPPESGVVRVDLNNGKGSARIHKLEDQIIYVEFTNEGYKTLNAHITPEDSKANLRFSQIILPDSRMNGPFGRDLNYDLNLDGNYKLLIHEDMMAGLPWSGNFTVTITLQQ